MILHGSRSGQYWTIAEEFDATVSWAQTGAPLVNPDGTTDYLGWNATIGESIIGTHIGPGSWGWNARRFSSLYLAVEFAQAHQDDAITDPQVNAFAWWYLHTARTRWPALPAVFPTHAELDRQLMHPDGKTDCFVDGSELRARIVAALATTAYVKLGVNG